MKTTVELPDMLFKRVKARTVTEGMKLKDYIARALEQSLEETSPFGRGARIESPPIKSKRRKPIPARSNAEMEELLIKESLKTK